MEEIEKILDEEKGIKRTELSFCKMQNTWHVNYIFNLFDFGQKQLDHPSQLGKPHKIPNLLFYKLPTSQILHCVYKKIEFNEI